MAGITAFFDDALEVEGFDDHVCGGIKVARDTRNRPRVIPQ